MAEVIHDGASDAGWADDEGNKWLLSCTGDINLSSSAEPFVMTHDPNYVKRELEALDPQIEYGEGTFSA